MFSSAVVLLTDVFRQIPHTMFCVKTVDGRYVAANESFALRAGRRRLRDVIGQTAADLFPPDLAASYDAQDRAVRTTGRAVRNQLEVIADGLGQTGWYLTTKVLQPNPIGDSLVVVSVPAPLGRGSTGGDGLRAAVECARLRFAEGLRVEDLAQAGAMSVDKLERSMQRALGTSPKQYLVRVRVEQAALLLATTDVPIAEIAARCGYYDQSQLTRQFRAHVGVTPGTYRKGRSAPG